MLTDQILLQYTEYSTFRYPGAVSSTRRAYLLHIQHVKIHFFSKKIQKSEIFFSRK